MKKIITLLLAAALLGSAVVFAADAETINYKERVFNKADLSEETLKWLEEFNALSKDEQDAMDYAPAELLARGGEAEAAADIEEIADEEETAVFEAKASMYVWVNATDAKVSETEDGVKEVSATAADGEEVIFTISENTLVIDTEGNAAEIKDGTQLDAYTLWSKPMVMSLPMRYDVDVIVVLDEEAQNQVSTDAFTAYEDGYINAAENLVIRSEESEIVDRAGKKYEGELGGKDLVVVYGMTTMSIPAQTNPEKIIVLGDSEELPPAADEIVSPTPATKICVGDKTFDIEEKNGVDMVKVRVVAEALGFEVGWDNDLQKVTVGTTAMGVNFNIGENKYNKARMMPIELEAAPVKVEIPDFGGVTYVPVSFFTDVIECTAELDGGVMTLSAM